MLEGQTFAERVRGLDYFDLARELHRLNPEDVKRNGIILRRKGAAATRHDGHIARARTRGAEGIGIHGRIRVLHFHDILHANHARRADIVGDTV